MKCDLLELRNDSYDAGMYLRVDKLLQKKMGDERR